MPIRGMSLRKLVVKLQKLSHPSRILSGRSSYSGRSISTPTGYSSDMEDQDVENSQYPVAADIPQGHLALYVGHEKQRFVVKAEYLNHSLFRALLDKSAEEFGFDHKGALLIPCEVVLFEHLLWMLQNRDPSADQLQIDDLLFCSSSILPDLNDEITAP